jgi:hypothetical protein
VSGINKTAIHFKSEETHKWVTQSDTYYLYRIFYRAHILPFASLRKSQMISNRKYLVVKGCAGLGNRLITAAALDYARKS